MHKKIFFIIFLYFLSLNLYGFNVKSSPSGASVFLNGVFVGVTPIKLSNVGKCVLELQKGGYKKWNYKLKGEEKSLWARLSPTNSNFSFIKRINTGRAPKDIIFSPDGHYLIITTMGEAGIQIYNMQTEEIKFISIPKYGRYAGYVEGVFSPDGKEFWFNQLGGRVFVLSMEDFTIKADIKSGGRMSKVGEFSPDGKLYYVSNWESCDITIIDRFTKKVLRRLYTKGKEPRGVGFSVDGNYLYVLYYGSGEIAKFDIKNDYKEVKRIYTGGSNGRFRLDPVKNIVYINNLRLSQIYTLDLATDTLSKPIKVWTHPNNIKLSFDYRYLYVSCRGRDNPKGYELRSPDNGVIQVFDCETMKIIEILPAGNQPIGLALTPDGKIFAFSNFMDATVEFYSVEL